MQLSLFAFEVLNELTMIQHEFVDNLKIAD